MPRRTALVAASLTTLLALTAAAPGQALAPERRAPLAVTGYIEGGSPASLVSRDAHALASVGVDGVSLTDGGTDVDTPDASLTGPLRTAHTEGLHTELLVSNYSNAIGDFDPAEGATLLRSAEHRDALADRLAGIVRRQGWDGITVDLESLRRADGPGLTAFVRRLQQVLPADRTVSIDLMASSEPGEYRDRGYQLAALGRAADVVALMTYDLHGPTWSGPGPIGPLAWQRAAARVVLAKVPAAKLDLGVAGYGYSWPAHGTGSDLTVAEARRMVRTDGATAVWKPGPAEWTATLSNGTVLWWSDGRSYAHRVTLARSLGVHGLAVWRLGSEDPL